MINDLWYKNAVVYCLSVGTYMDANGDGIGDFQGLSRRLDYLHGLGVTAIWLMPFQKSPCRDDGYDVSDYYAVDPRYGTLGDFVEFAHGAKQRGIRVLIDLVVNHTSNEHPWFQEARKDPKSKYRDWYIWSKTKPPNANEGMVFPGVDRHGVFRRRRRPHAHDVQLPGQPAPVLRARRGRHGPARQGHEGDEAAAGDGAMGAVPAQSRRARPRAPDRRAAPDRVRRLRAGRRHAALRARHPPPPRADARRRPAPHRARLQPDVHAARDAGDPLRRRARHGRRSQAPRAQLRPARRCNGRPSLKAASPSRTSRSCR